MVLDIVVTHDMEISTFGGTQRPIAVRVNSQYYYEPKIQHTRYLAESFDHGLLSTSV